MLQDPERSVEHLALTVAEWPKQRAEGGHVVCGCSVHDFSALVGESDPKASSVGQAGRR
jgi:hypothetical protein